jgi:hypothetical protein
MPKKKEEKEITPEQTPKEKPVTTDEETNRLFEDGDIDDLVEDSPVVSAKVVEENKEMAKKNESESTNESAKEQTEEKETTEQKEEKLEQDEKSQKATEEESEPEPEKVKIGDQEYTPEEAAAFKAEYDKKKEWEERLRKQSMIAANLNDDEIQAATSVVSGDRKLPDQSAEVVDSILQEVLEGKKVEVKDDDGEYSIDVTDKVKEAVAKAVKATLQRVEPVLNKAKQEIQSSQRKAVSTFISNFMDKHPEYKVVVPDDIPIDQYMDMVDNTGPSHPDFAALARYKILSDAAKRMGYVGPDSLDKAYTFLYGNLKGKVETAEDKAAKAAETQKKILKNQEKLNQEKPGGQVESKDDVDLILEEVEDPSYKALKELGVM